MVFQAYIDDSADNNVLVLAGYIAPLDAWMGFAEEWKEQIDNFGGKPFKTSQMARSEDGIRKAEIFYRIIERHVTAGISCAVYKDDLVKVLREVPRPAPILDIDKLENAYYPAFTGIMATFTHFQESIGIEEAVDFIFDDQSEKSNLFNTWNLLKASANPNVRRFLGADPRFENDQDFQPLQAADLFAWWVRRWESEGAYDNPSNILPSFPWERKRQMVHARIIYREHDLREELEDILSDRSLFLLRQPADVLRQIDEGRLYEEEIRKAATRKRKPLFSRSRRFLRRFRGD